MIPLSIKPLGFSLLIGLIVGVCLTLSFKGCGRDSDLESVPIINPKQIIKAADKTEAEYQKKVAELKLHGEKLEHQLKELQSELSLLKSKTKNRELTIKKMIEPKGFPAKKLVKGGRSESISIDSSLSPCDSLAVEVDGYITDNIRKDSLYEAQSQIKDSIIAVKDSVILTTIKVYQDFKTLLDQSVKQQELLFSQNKLLKKQLKRQKFRSTMKTLGFIILSGAAGFLAK
jgi:hypothetical protein